MALNLKELFQNLNTKLAEKFNALDARIDNIIGGGISADAGNDIVPGTDGLPFYQERTPEDIATDYEGLPNTNKFEDSHKQTIIDFSDRVINSDAALASKLDRGTYQLTASDLEAAKVDKVPGKQLSTEDFTTEEKAKLAGLEGSKFKGTYLSIAALEAAHPAPEAGSYAYVDAGAGTDVVEYIWDANDGKWVEGNTTGSTETAATIKSKYESNPDTNAYTDAEKAKVANVPADTNAELAGKQSTSEKGQANGYAPLGADSKVPAAHLPAERTNAEIVSAIDTQLGSTEWQTQKTLEQIQDIVAAMFQSGVHTNASVAYDDVAGTISISASGSGTAMSEEEIEDIVGGFAIPGDGINITYDDVNNTLTFTLAGEIFTTLEKNKLAGIADNANNYVHPATHAPSIIAQDTNNRFVTDTEKAAWNAKNDPDTSAVPFTGVLNASKKVVPEFYVHVTSGGPYSLSLAANPVNNGSGFFKFNGNVPVTVPSTWINMGGINPSTVSTDVNYFWYHYNNGELHYVIKVISTADTEPPTTPTGLTASNVTESGYTLTWNDDSTDNVGVTGYEVSVGGGAFVAATSPHVISGLTGADGTVSSVSLMAKDAAGNTSPSAQLEVYMKFALLLGANSDADPTKVNLSWQAVTADVNIDNYIIERSTDNVTWSPLTTITDGSQNYIDTGLTASTTYYYRIKATDNEGLHPESDWATDSITTGSSANPILSILQPLGEWYDFTDNTDGVFTGELEKNGNYTTAVVGGSPDYVAGKLSFTRADNDAISLGDDMSFIKDGVDGFTIFMKFAPTEIGYTAYFVGQTSSNYQLIVALNIDGTLQLMTKWGSSTLVINKTANAIWSGAGPYTAKSIFIEVDKTSGNVSIFVDNNNTPESLSTSGSIGTLTNYTGPTTWYLGGRNNGGLDTANDLSALFEHLIINPKKFTATEKQTILNNV